MGQNGSNNVTSNRAQPPRQQRKEQPSDDAHLTVRNIVKLSNVRKEVDQVGEFGSETVSVFEKVRLATKDQIREHIMSDPVLYGRLKRTLKRDYDVDAVIEKMADAAASKMARAAAFAAVAESGKPLSRAARAATAAPLTTQAQALAPRPVTLGKLASTESDPVMLAMDKALPGALKAAERELAETLPRSPSLVKALSMSLESVRFEQEVVLGLRGIILKSLPTLHLVNGIVTGLDVAQAKAKLSDRNATASQKGCATGALAFDGLALYGNRIPYVNRFGPIVPAASGIGAGLLSICSDFPHPTQTVGRWLGWSAEPAAAAQEPAPGDKP